METLNRLPASHTKGTAGCLAHLGPELRRGWQVCFIFLSSFALSIKEEAIYTSHSPHLVPERKSEAHPSVGWTPEKPGLGSLAERSERKDGS